MLEATNAGNGFAYFIGLWIHAETQNQIELLEILQDMGFLCACKNMYPRTSGTDTLLSTTFVTEMWERKTKPKKPETGDVAFSRLFVSEPPA